MPNAEVNTVNNFQPLYFAGKFYIGHSIFIIFTAFPLISIHEKSALAASVAASPYNL